MPSLSESKKTDYYKKLSSAKKAYLHYVDFEAKQARGEWWIQQITGWFSIEKFGIYMLMLQSIFQYFRWNVALPIIWVIIVIWFLSREIYPFFIGFFDFGKKSFLALNNRYMANHPIINPWQHDAKEQFREYTNKLNEAFQKLGIDTKVEDKFRDL